MISKERRTSLLYGFVALLFSIVLYFNANGQTVQSTLSGNEAYTSKLFRMCRFNYYMIRINTISTAMRVRYRKA